MTDTFTLQPIGIVRSPYLATSDVPLQGGPATLEIFPEFEAALDGLAACSHLVVMAFLHHADRGALATKPARIDPTAPPRGVFASRSPARPNPVSLTVVALLEQHGLRLTVEPLDLLDGTPLIDLKAYAPGWDSVFCARHQHRAPPSALDLQRLAAFLERDLANFMGCASAEPAARWALAAIVIASRALGIDPRDPDLHVHTNRGGLTAEALMALTGAAAFNRRLTASPDTAPLRFRFCSGSAHVELTAVRGDLPADCSGWADSFQVTGRID